MKQYLCSGRKDCRKGNHNFHLQGAAAPRLWGCSVCAPDLSSLTKAKNWKSLFFVPDFIKLATKPSILKYPCKVFFGGRWSLRLWPSFLQPNVEWLFQKSNSPQKCPTPALWPRKGIGQGHVSIRISCSLSFSFFFPPFFLFPFPYDRNLTR